MARPTTKPDLLKAANGEFEKMWELIDSMTADEQKAAFDFGNAFAGKEAHWERDKNLRDVLVHLYEWHQLLLDWVESNQKGEQKPFLPAPYNWRSYGQMNVGFWEKHQGTSLHDAKEMVKESHETIIKLINHFSNDELFSKGIFPWAGTNTVGSYCVSTTASHYGWAMKKIKAHKKTYKC